MAVTVHLEFHGVPLSMLLDIVEVAKSHTGVALAEEFDRILEEFEVASKVSRARITIIVFKAYQTVFEAPRHHRR
jgi:hypothetical protein